jgi:hypothetical protein
MARGFESKQVESQQEEAARPKTVAPALTAEEAERLDRRRTLELSRARLVADLQRASVPAYRKMLEEALAALDAQLSELSSQR